MKKSVIVSGVLILVLILINCISGFAVEKETSLPNGIYLHTDSPLILSKGVIAPLDPDNLDVAATVVESRTLLPLRALSEYFGAQVTYDNVGRKAIIDFKEKQFIFPINENVYIVKDGKDKKEVKMDTKSMNINNRTMVPIRVICEDILNLKVSYYDRVIAIADSEIDLKANKILMEDVKSKIGVALKARTINELRKALANSSTRYEYTTMIEKTMASDTAAAQNSSKEAESVQDATNSDSNYSTTNTQIEGIDEADIVKTDGKYIYIAGNNAVRIVETDNGKLSDDAIIRLSQNKNVQEIYVDNNRLVLIGNRWEQNTYPIDGIRPLSDEAETMKILPPYYRSKNYSFIDIYDISNPKRPIFLKGHEMEGSYQTSRKNGDIVYLISNTYVYGDIVLPMMRDTVINNEMVSVKLEDVMIMSRCPMSGYVVISAIDITNNEKTRVEAITAAGHITYMNDHALFLAANENDGMTVITKFALDGMNVGYAGSGKVKGYLLNQFSMDEYKGHLRVATTTWDNDNNLYVLDESLNLSGSITNLAKDERIYSVRFLGDKGYIVTFRNIDPLFVFDLSDPENPKATGELKIPGFSNYLHPVGENMILGIGLETHEIYQKDENGKEVVIGNRQGGIKFSLFDVSDMGKPKEIAKYVVGKSGSYSEALYNHKAVVFDIESKNIMFDATISSEEMGGVYKQGAILMNYGHNNFTLKGFIESVPAEEYGNYIPYGRRVIYIGDELYYIQDGRISSYRYDTLAPIDTISLKQQ